MVRAERTYSHMQTMHQTNRPLTTTTNPDTDTHELLYIAFDLVYLAGEGAVEVFHRANLAPCAVRAFIVIVHVWRLDCSTGGICRRMKTPSS